MEDTKELITTDDIRSKVYIIRGQQVMLDKDLAEIYGYEVKRLNEQVKRNISRFPEDFMFQLNREEIPEGFSKSQFATLNEKSNRQGSNIKKMPFAFTEQGVSMLSAVLRSSVAIQTSITIMRAFVAMRNYILQSTQVSAELLELRSRLQLVEHDCRENLEAVNDLSEDMRKDIDAIYEAIGALSVKLPEAKKSRQPIGFVTGNKED